jgi:hypothetical protein
VCILLPCPASCPVLQLLVAGKLTPAADVYSLVFFALPCAFPSCCVPLLQLLVAGKLTPAADVYSFGIMSEWALLAVCQRQLS